MYQERQFRHRPSKTSAGSTGILCPLWISPLSEGMATLATFHFPNQVKLQVMMSWEAIQQLLLSCFFLDEQVSAHSGGLSLEFWLQGNYIRPCGIWNPCWTIPTTYLYDWKVLGCTSKWICLHTAIVLRTTEYFHVESSQVHSPENINGQCYLNVLHFTMQCH